MVGQSSSSGMGSRYIYPVVFFKLIEILLVQIRRLALTTYCVNLPPSMSKPELNQKERPSAVCKISGNDGPPICQSSSGCRPFMA